MSYKMQTMLNDLKNQIEYEYKLNAEVHANFIAYLEELIDMMQKTPADNLEQDLQRTSCIVLVEEIQEKYTELLSKGLQDS